MKSTGGDASQSSEAILSIKTVTGVTAVLQS